MEKDGLLLTLTMPALGQITVCYKLLSKLI